MRGLAFLLLLGCATTSAGPDIAVHLEQLTPSDNFRFAGPVNVEYRVTASNPTAAPVTLTRIDLHTAGPGAYVLRTPTQPLNLHVPANSSASAVINAPATALGGRANSVEPVTVRVTAYFEGPGGLLVRLGNETFGQLGRE